MLVFVDKFQVKFPNSPKLDSCLDFLCQRKSLMSYRSGHMDIFQYPYRCQVKAHSAEDVLNSSNGLNQ
jgi:hypothetical protein